MTKTSLITEVFKIDMSDTVSVDCFNVADSRNQEDSRSKNLYKVEDKPPLAFLVLNSIQVVVCQVASVVWLPLGLCPLLCLLPADPIRVYLISTAFLASGVLSSLQSTLGVRLPMVVSVSPVVSAALMSLLKSPTVVPPCPGGGDLYAMGPTLRVVEWQERLRLVQGALLLAGAAQAAVGLSGLQSSLCRVLGPVSIAPALVLAGVTGVTSGILGDSYQPFLIIVAVLMVLFALGLRDISLHVPKFSLHSGLVAKRIHLFRMFPVLWASGAVYLIYKVFSMPMPYPNIDLVGFQEAVDNSKWFFFPFPFEWGPPTVSMASVVHLLPAVLLQSVTSLLLMYADADICGVAMPPRSAVSRGLTVEGLGLMFGSLWGHGVAVDSTNISLMSFTGIVSRSSVQLAAVMMICMSHFPGLLSIIANIPTQFLVAVQLFLQVGLVLTGISILRFVNFKSSRDSSVVGLSIVFGLMVPRWQSTGLVVNTGLPAVDNCIAQCLASSVFMAMVTGCLLDICLPGRTSNQRTHPWRHRDSSDKATYRLPTWEELLCSILEKLSFFSSD